MQHLLGWLAAVPTWAILVYAASVWFSSHLAAVAAQRARKRVNWADAVLVFTPFLNTVILAALWVHDVCWIDDNDDDGEDDDDDDGKPIPYYS